MTVMIGLLRGVNVGGRSKVSMADLRRAVAARGYDDVQTYIQSGNVLLRTTRRSTAAVARDLEAAVGDVAEVADPAAVVLTRDELADVVASNPFADRGGDPPPIHVAFAVGRTALRLDLDVDAFAPEAAAVVGRCTYLWLPDGIGRSPLAAALSRRPGPPGTVRNWRTVTTLLRLADELA